MRVHMTLAESDVRRLDARVGSRRRSRFIAEAVRRAMDDEERWESSSRPEGLSRKVPTPGTRTLLHGCVPSARATIAESVELTRAARDDGAYWRSDGLGFSVCCDLMASVLLDTTVLIDLLRGRPGAVRRLRGLRSLGDRPRVCAINV